MPADRQPPPHAEATLLPWYLNGTLTAEETRMGEGGEVAEGIGRCGP